MSGTKDKAKFRLGLLRDDRDTRNAIKANDNSISRDGMIADRFNIAPDLRRSEEVKLSFGEDRDKE